MSKNKRPANYDKLMQDKSGGQRPPLNSAAVEQSLPGESRLDPNRTRTLQLLRAGSFQLAVFQDEIATIVEWRDPAPLPYAPRSVLGVVSIQGRMLTVLDLATLTNTQSSSGHSEFQHILALRGDEQLALAANALDEKITIAEEQVENTPGLFLRVLKPGNGEINLLNTKELFSIAMQGRERRRRRF